MQAFLEYVLKNLVDHPEEVSVTRVDQNGRALYEIRVRPGDVGKVVGKQGQTISAIRGLMIAAASKFNERVDVEIIEDRSLGEAPGGAPGESAPSEISSPLGPESGSAPTA